MEEFDKGEVIVQFEWHSRKVSIRASAKGYAAIWLKRNPWTTHMRAPRIEHERRALQQGQIAIYSMLREWLKGQCMAIETGILSSDAAFLGQIMLPSGETVLEIVERGNVV